MTFGKRLRSVRKDLGLTQKELGERIGVGRTTISEYESGKIVPRQDGLIKLAEVLGVNVDFLTGTQAGATWVDDGYVCQLEDSLLSMIRMINASNVKVRFFESELTDDQTDVVKHHLRSILMTLEEFEKCNCYKNS